MTIGTCNCSAVSFEVEGKLRDIYACHCSICRRWTGTNGVAVVIVPSSKFRWLKGEDQISKWRKPDADWVSCFCKSCGSSLPIPNDEQSVAVPAGLIDGKNNNLRVAAHIWVGSKPSWDEISDSCPHFSKGFEA